MIFKHCVVVLIGCKWVDFFFRSLLRNEEAEKYENDHQDHTIVQELDLHIFQQLFISECAKHSPGCQKQVPKTNYLCQTLVAPFHFPPSCAFQWGIIFAILGFTSSSTLLQKYAKNLNEDFSSDSKSVQNCKVEGNHLEKIVFQVIPLIYHNLDFLSAGIFEYHR